MNADVFLRAIDDSPDDVHRLVYADWLDDHGEPAFAEFIRVQCRLAALLEENAEWLSLKVREEELFRHLHDDRWAEHRRNMTSVHGDTKTLKVEWFDRGLLRLHLMIADPEVFVRESARWIFLLSVTDFTAGGAMCDGFFGCGQLWKIDRFNCERCGVRDSSMQGFAQAQHFFHTHSFDFFRNDIGPAGIAAFARCPSLRKLSTLTLQENELGDEGVETLVSSPVCGSLLSLDLSANGVGARGARAVMASAHLESLVALSLGSNPIPPHVCRDLQEWANRAGIRELELPLDWDEDETAWV